MESICWVKSINFYDHKFGFLDDFRLFTVFFSILSVTFTTFSFAIGNPYGIPPRNSIFLSILFLPCTVSNLITFNSIFI